MKSGGRVCPQIRNRHSQRRGGDHQGHRAETTAGPTSPPIGAQHATKPQPFDSWFAMGDGKLALMCNIQERYINSETLCSCLCVIPQPGTHQCQTKCSISQSEYGLQGDWDAVKGRWSLGSTRRCSNIQKSISSMRLRSAAPDTANEVPSEKRIKCVHIVGI